MRTIKDLLKGTGAALAKDAAGCHHLSDERLHITDLRKKEKYRKNGNILDFVNHSSGLPKIWQQKRLDGETPDNKQRTIIAFEPLFDADYMLKGENRLPEKLRKLFQAALEEHAVAIKVENYCNETYEGVLYPEFLKQYMRHWYVFGMMDREGEGMTRFVRIPVNRIADKVVVKKNKAFKFSGEDYDDYFDDFVGVDNMDGMRRPETVVMQIKNSMVERVQMEVLGDYRFTRRPEHDAKERQGYSIKLIINRELERIILRYASDIKILQPESLVKTIKKELTKAAKLYE